MQNFSTAMQADLYQYWWYSCIGSEY